MSLQVPGPFYIHWTQPPPEPQAGKCLYPELQESPQIQGVAQQAFLVSPTITERTFSGRALCKTTSPGPPGPAISLAPPPQPSMKTGTLSHTTGQQATLCQCPTGSADAPLTAAAAAGSPANEGQVTRSPVTVDACPPMAVKTRPSGLVRLP